MIIGILSISYLVGDAAARQWMGMLIQHGYGWRALFYFAAAVVGLFLILNFLFLRESRVEGGFAEAKPNPLNLFAESESRPKSVAQLLLPLISSRAFIVVCILSLGCTVIREAFNFWTPQYLRDYLGYSSGSAARRLSSSVASTNRSMLRPATSSRIMSPFRTSASGPPM